ncbi:MAG: hypothetical protein IJY61_05435 [Candidatus Gastranaerophilales bacterium]|nr:hypothetical protein [Candidatus Gastranaerophilales bacterium]
MKKYIISLFLISVFVFPQTSFAENTIPVNSAIKTVHSRLYFAKSYKTTSENLLYLLLSAINEYNYSIEEIQFKTGSVLFKAYSKEFIASISAKDGYNSFIKIIPADNNYNFSPNLIQKLHTYIENNNSTYFQKIL